MTMAAPREPSANSIGFPAGDGDRCYAPPPPPAGENLKKKKIYQIVRVVIA